MAKRGVKCRNFNTMTEAKFWAMFREMYRKLSMYWKPGEEYLKSIRVPNTNGNKQQKYSYPCSLCLGLFSRKEVEKDHIIPVGNISSWETLAKAGERMFIEIDGGWRCLCKSCHYKITHNRDE